MPKLRKNNPRQFYVPERSQLCERAEEFLGITVDEVADGMDTDDANAYTHHPFILGVIDAVMVGIFRAANKKHGDRWRT